MNRAIIWIVVIVALVYYTQQPEAAEQSSNQPATTVAEDTLTPLTSMLPPQDKPTRVVVIGDSLTVGMSPFWPSNGDKLRVDIDATNGRPLHNANAIVKQSVGRTDAYVMALGTNDCMSNPDEDEIRNLIISSLNTSEAKPVILLTLGESGAIRDCAKRFNAVAKRLAANIPSLELGDWQAYIHDHPEWYGETGDGIHLTPDGYKARAEWLNSLVVT